MKKHTHKGIGMVEAVVAAAIFSVILGTLITTSNWYLSGAAASTATLKAAYLAEEGVETIKILRDNAWTQISSLSLNTNYYLQFPVVGGYAVPRATTTATSTDGFIRTVRFSEVRRDAQGRIVASGGTVDLNTKKVDIQVSWAGKTGTTTKSISTYVTKIGQ